MTRSVFHAILFGGDCANFLTFMKFTTQQVAKGKRKLPILNAESLDTGNLTVKCNFA